MNNLSNMKRVEVNDLVIHNRPLPMTKYSSESLLTVKKSKKVLDIERAVKTIQKGYKVLIIMRGLPGSGKSFLSKQILESTIGFDNNYKIHILSSDDYFTRNTEGTYKYNSSHISDAHNWNQRRAFEALSRGFSPVIIDNTNTQMWEMQPYATMAIDYGYIIEILEPDTHWCFNDKELTKRNKHGVSKAKIVEMTSRYEKNVTPQKLLCAYNLTYRFQKLPQLRLYPPLNVGFSSSSTNINSNSNQSENLTFVTSANNMVTVDFQAKQKKNPVETIDLMEFNDDEEDMSNPHSKEKESSAVFSDIKLQELKTKTLVDEILMVSNDSTNSGGVLQPQHNTDVITIDSDDEDASVKSDKPLFPNIETAWGINESVLRSWDIVSPIENSDNLISFPSNNKVDKKVVTKEASSNTDEKDFDLVKNNNCSMQGIKILNTVNRDINRSTPKRENKIPKKVTIDKSCMTEDVYDDFENHMEELTSLFPSVPVTHLTYWYNKCKGDLEWTIEFLLEAEEADILIDESMMAVEKSEIDNSTESAKDQEEKSVIENGNQKTVKSKKLIKNSYNDIKKVIESKIDISPSNYSKHLLRIKNFKFKNGNHDTDPQLPSTSEKLRSRNNSSGDNSKDDDVIVIDSDMECEEMDMDITYEKEEPEKMVELNLGDNFVTQLEQQFGDANINYPKGFQPVVQVPETLARQLYTFYLESVFQQMETQKQIMETLTKEDEEFARKLQEKEQEEMAGTSAKPSMSFKEIMEEQETLSQLQKESEKWKAFTPDNLAARLTRQKLFKSFPTIDPETLVEILYANDNKYEETVESLLASIGHENIHGSIEVIKEPPIKDEVLNEMKDAQKNSTCEVSYLLIFIQDIQINRSTLEVEI